MEERWVDVSHEALIRGWPRLRKWIEEDRAGLLVHRRLSEAVHEWQRLNRDEGVLYRGARLAQAVEWRERNEVALNELERAFLNASLRAEAEGVRRKRRRRGIAWATGVGVAALIAGFVWTRYASGIQRHARDLALAANQERDSSPLESVHMALESFRLVPSVGEPGLRVSLDAAKALRIANGEHANPVHDVAVGQTVLASASWSGSRLWKPSGGTPVVLDANEQAESIALDANDTVVVTAGEKGVRVWRDGVERPPLISADDAVAGQVASISRDGKTIAATSREGVRIWTSADGSWQPGSLQEGPLLKGQQVNSVALSPDSTLAVTAHGVGTVRVWDIQTGQALVTLPGHEGGALDAVFGPDGMTVASSGRDHMARIWSTRGPWSGSTWQMDMILGGHSSDVWKVAYSPGGRFVATASADNTAAIWEVSSGALVARLRGHLDEVRSVAFSPDGTMVATGGADHTVRLWRTGAETYPLPHEDTVRSARFSADGSFVLTASRGHHDMACIWQAGSGELVGSLRARPGTLEESVLEDVALDPGDRWIVGAGEDGKVKVWDAKTCEPVTEFKAHDGDVRTLDFESTPGSAPSVLITTAVDGQVRRWEVGTWKRLEAVAQSNIAPPSPRATAESVARSGDLVVTAEYDSAVVLDTRNGETRRLPAHLGPVFGVAFSPNGRTIVTASGDRTARIHPYADFAPSERLEELANELSAVPSSFWSPTPPSFHSCPRPEPRR